jgi:gluconolactonase
LQSLPNYESEKIASNLRFVDGLAWSHSGFLAVADVGQKKIFKVGADPHPPVLVDNVAEAYEGKKFNAPNDIVVRRDGHVYFADPAFGNAGDHRDLDFYGIFHISPKGDLDVVAKWQTRPNGVTVSTDGKVLYVTDSDRHAVAAFDLDRNGAASNQRDVIKNIAGVPGGIKLDADGRFYIAAQGVATYSPQGRLERTLLEGERAINCAFGDTNLDWLFIAARTSIYRAKVGAKGALQY